MIEEKFIELSEIDKEVVRGDFQILWNGGQVENLRVP